jgi:hypothetical protein
MPVGKGSIERAVRAKNAAGKERDTAAVPQKAGQPEEKIKSNVIGVASPEVLAMVTGKRQEKPVKLGETMPEYLL